MSVALAPSGATWAVGTYDGDLRWIDIAQRKTLTVLPGHQGGVTGLRFTAEGDELVSGGWDGRLRLWDVGARRLLGDLEAHQWPVGSIHIVGATMLSRSRDGTRLWSLSTALPSRRLTGTVADIQGLTVAPDGRFALSTVLNRSVWPRDPADRAPEWFMEPMRPCLSFTPDGSQLWFQGTGSGVVRWLQPPEVVSADSMIRPGAELIDCAFTRDGTSLITTDVRQNVTAWDVHTGSRRWSAPVGGWPLRLDVGADGRILVASGEGGAVALAADGRELWRYQPSGSLASVARWEPQQNMVVVGDSAGRILLLSPDGQLESLFHAHRGNINDVAFSPDSATLASAALINPSQAAGAEFADDVLTGDSGLRLWSTTSWTRTADLFGHDASVLHVAFTADGGSLISAGRNGQAFQWRGPAGWLAQACAVAGRDLTEQERATYLTALSIDPDC